MPEPDIKFEDDFFNMAIASRYKAYGKNALYSACLLYTSDAADD